MLTPSSSINYYYFAVVLQSRSSEVILDEFACRANVNVSFKLATDNFNVSNYSPPAVINVTNNQGESHWKLCLIS